MGRLLREVMEEERNLVSTFSKEMLPELLLLGTLEHREISLDTGKMVSMDVVEYAGKYYVMKVEEVGRWFGTLQEIQKGERL